jgi:hypothetical protein
MMKKQITMIAMAALMGVGLTQLSYGGETSLAGYLTYWDGAADGLGGGIKVRKKFMGFLSADVRASYVDFSDLNTTVVPLEATFMVGIPFVLEPYAGVGAGYYLIDSEVLGEDNSAGYYGVLGVQFNMFVVGALAEIRYNEGESSLLNGPSANIGLLVKW